MEFNRTLSQTAPCGVKDCPRTTIFLDSGLCPYHDARASQPPKLFNRIKAEENQLQLEPW